MLLCPPAAFDVPNDAFSAERQESHPGETKFLNAILLSSFCQQIVLQFKALD
jgi:hypothetical protein